MSLDKVTKQEWWDFKYLVLLPMYFCAIGFCALCIHMPGAYGLYFTYIGLPVAGVVGLWGIMCDFGVDKNELDDETE